jgi:hypothetical protein
MADGTQEEILRRWRLTMEDMKAALANLKSGLVRTRSIDADPDKDIARLEGQIVEFDAFLSKCVAENRPGGA